MVMRNSLLMGLAPVLVIAAFAVMPVAARAEPHYYESGTLIAEVEKVPIVEWGTLNFHPFPDVAPLTTCESTMGGYVSNGAEVGIGATSEFVTYNCVNANCPPGKVTIEGRDYEKEFTVDAQGLPWPNTLIEEEGIRVLSTNVELAIGCVAHGLSNTSPPGGTEPGKPGAQEQFYMAPPTVCVTTPERQQKPVSVPGRNTTITSKVQYDQFAGGLSCAGGAVEGKTAGSLKVMGYRESELITAKSP